MPDLTTEIPALMDRLLEPVLNPPNGKMAIMMIDETSRLHIAAISGMLQHADTQAGIDEAYLLIDKHFNLMREQLHEVLYMVAKSNDLEPRNISDVNLQTRLDIEALLAKEGK